MGRQSDDSLDRIVGRFNWIHVPCLLILMGMYIHMCQETATVMWFSKRTPPVSWPQRSIHGWRYADGHLEPAIDIIAEYEKYNLDPSVRDAIAFRK